MTHESTIRACRAESAAKSQDYDVRVEALRRASTSRSDGVGCPGKLLQDPRWGGSIRQDIINVVELSETENGQNRFQIVVGRSKQKRLQDTAGAKRRRKAKPRTSAEKRRHRDGVNRYWSKRHRVQPGRQLTKNWQETTRVMEVEENSRTKELEER